MSTTQYGTLAGPGFTIMFALATLIAGRLTDTLDRRFLHTGAVLVWSLAAAGHGTCTSFNCLLVSERSGAVNGIAKEGRGAYSFIDCSGRLTVGHASLSRRGTIPVLPRNQSSHL